MKSRKPERTMKSISLSVRIGISIFSSLNSCLETTIVFMPSLCEFSTTGAVDLLERTSLISAMSESAK